ncbi:MAG: ribose 5-phosphate isomerase B [Clostridia bacterium]|nr:ribose 5-phosphate isomerase B [Clostridia bacterium]
MKVVIASDHGGFTLKEELKKYIAELGHDVADYGAHSQDPVDYPDFAFLVAEAVAAGVCDRGIMIDGIGAASAIVANKVAGIRAASCSDTFTAMMSRAHNDSNVLTLGARVIGGGLAREIVRTWLSTEFEGGRHMRRVTKIIDFERRRFAPKE